MPYDILNIAILHSSGNDCYFVARGGNNEDKAVLLSPCYVTPSPAAEDVGVSFALFSFGPNAGTLTMYWRPGCLEPNDLPDELGNVGVTISGSLSNLWLSPNPQIDRNRIPMGLPFQVIIKPSINDAIEVVDS